VYYVKSGADEYQNAVIGSMICCRNCVAESENECLLKWLLLYNDRGTYEREIHVY